MKLPPLLNRSHLPETSLLGRLGLALTSALAIVAGFALASLLLSILLIGGLAVGGWLWWRFRQLAQQAQNVAPDVIEGEYTVVTERLALTDERSPPPRHLP